MTLDFGVIPPILKADVLSGLIHVLAASRLICFWAPFNNDVLSLILGSCRQQSSFRIFQNGSSDQSASCSHLVVIDHAADDILALFSSSDSKISWKNTVVVLNARTFLNVSYLGTHAGVFSSAQVLVVSGGETCSLSSPFDESRTFSEFWNTVDVSSMKDFNGRSVPIIDPRLEPLSIIYKNDSEADGLIRRIVNDLASLLNLKWEFLKPDWLEDSPNVHPSNGAGRRYIDWTVRMLKSGEAEVHFGILWWEDWYLVAEEVGPCLSDVFIAALARRPVVLTDRWRTLTQLLAPPVWLCVLAGFVLTTIVYWLAAGLRFGLLDSTLAVLQPLLLTGRTPGASAAGLVLASWSLFALLNATALTSTIVQRFSLPVFSARIDTQEQLRDAGFYPWLPPNDAVLREEIRAEVTRLLKSDEPVFFYGVRIGADLVGLLKVGRFVDERDKAKLRVIGEDLTLTFTSINCRQNGVYCPAVSRGAQRLLEAGLLERERRAVSRAWLSPAERRFAVDEDRPLFDSPEPLTLFKLKPAFSLLLAGLAAASALFVFELTHRRCAVR